MYAWQLGLKTGQYYLRSRPARDAIQFTLDLDACENNVTQNLTQAEMDANKRLRKKRPHSDVTKDTKAPVASIDLNKKRKLTVATTAVPEKKVSDVKATETASTAKDSEAKAEKPWEGKPEEEEDHRWAVCENCQ
jgi:hypothetical protein